MGPHGQYCISSLDSPFCSSHYIYDRATAVVAAERYRFIRKWPMSGALGHCRETWAHAPPSGHAVADKSGKSSLYNARKKGSATIPPTRQANCALVAALRCVRERCGIREGLRQACGVGRGHLPLRKNP